MLRSKVKIIRISFVMVMIDVGLCSFRKKITNKPRKAEMATVLEVSQSLDTTSAGTATFFP